MATKSKRRSYTREQLLKHLEILPLLTAPLPPDLPPSPPASRATSPAPGNKRKQPSDASAEPPKRHRTSGTLERPAQREQSRRPAPVRPESAEDGEVYEQPSRAAASAAAAQATPVSLPIRRPRRGKPTKDRWLELHNQHHPAARQLKYSSEARFYASFPPSHKDYRPLANPPTPGSAYHQNGSIIARLEALDALICFTYGIWCKDCRNGMCDRLAWESIREYSVWCKAKWRTPDTVGDREKVFLGLLSMIEGFIYARRVAFANQYTALPALEKLQKVLAAEAASTAVQPEASGSSSKLTANGATPPMLPSPASIGTNSANSTPSSRTLGSGTSDGQPSAATIAAARLQAAPPATNAATVTVPVQQRLLSDLRDQAVMTENAKNQLLVGQRFISLPALNKHFPNTFARMVSSTLQADEEYEPDIEDEEGELYWPGQSMTGEGLGWVCLMGKAMIREFGKEYGYMGIKGVIPKPTQ